MPRISDLLINVPIEVFSGILLYFVFIYRILIFKKNKRKLTIKTNILFLIVGILISSIYFLLRAFINYNDLRIIQNSFIIIQIIHVIFLIDLMENFGYKRDNMINVLLKLGSLQGIICILMLIVPNFRQLALNLYYLGREENIFISQMRIYGISGDYTFFTPIYHGMLASVAFFYATFKNRRYFVYIPFILVSVFLNGRFGLLIFLTGIFTLLVYLFYKKKVSIKLAKYLFLLIILIIVFFSLLHSLTPHTYDWIISGFEELLNLIIYNERTGNVQILHDMLFFPNGAGLIFGEGHRVFGSNSGYPYSSDIGYVNDLFMGGLIYVFILYGTIFKFLLKKVDPLLDENKNDRYINEIISIFLVLTLIISNYKGESMRSGLILLGAVFIKLILMQSNNSLHMESIRV